MDEVFELSEEDRRNPLWLKLKARYEEKLKWLRARNDDQKLTEADTQILRGKIAEIKAFLALDQVFTADQDGRK